MLRLRLLCGPTFQNSRNAYCHFRTTFRVRSGRLLVCSSVSFPLELSHTAATIFTWTATLSQADRCISTATHPYFMSCTYQAHAHKVHRHTVLCTVHRHELPNGLRVSSAIDTQTCDVLEKMLRRHEPAAAQAHESKHKETKRVCSFFFSNVQLVKPVQCSYALTSASVYLSTAYCSVS